MKFHVLVVLGGTPQWSNRKIVDVVLEVSEISELRGKVSGFLREILHEEPCSTEIVSVSHTRL